MTSPEGLCELVSASPRVRQDRCCCMERLAGVDALRTGQGISRSEALQVHGYEWSLGTYSEARQFTLFVGRQTAGQSGPTPEACVQIVVDGDDLRVRIVAAGDTTLESEVVPAGEHWTFVDIAKRAFSYLLELSGAR